MGIECVNYSFVVTTVEERVTEHEGDKGAAGLTRSPSFAHEVLSRATHPGLEHKLQLLSKRHCKL